MRYKRQGHEIVVPVDRESFEAEGTEALVRRFGELHEQFYGFDIESESELISLRVIALGRVPEPSLGDGANGGGVAEAKVGESEVYSAGERTTAPIYDRAHLTPGDKVSGPAIVTEFDSTTVVLAGYEAEIDADLNLLIRPTES